MNDNVTEKLADAVTKIGFEQLPQAVVDRVKWVLLDSIGCALGALQTDKARIALELTSELGGKRQASIIGGPATSYAQAAFVNGELISALDYDYVGPLSGHIFPYVAPPCLAMAEREDASGRDLLVALAVGMEIGGRMGNALVQAQMPKKDPPYYEESLTYTYAHSVFGAVAGAGKLLGFDSPALQNAFGVAGMSNPVPAGMKWSRTGGPSFMLKYGAWTGWISQLATVAALITEKGFTGDKTVLDGKWGYWQMAGSPFFNVEGLLGGLGEEWHSARGEFKPYPCCRCNHAGIDGITSLMRTHGIGPQDIEEIVVKGDAWLQQPCRTATELTGPLDVQFANIFIFGLAPYEGTQPGPHWGDVRVYDTPQVRDMAKKVKIDMHPRTDELIAENVKAGRKPGFRKTIVELKAKGQRFVTEIQDPWGGPDNPLVESDLLRKFQGNAAASTLAQNKVDAIIDATLSLEKLKKMRKLARLWLVRD